MKEFDWNIFAIFLEVVEYTNYNKASKKVNISVDNIKDSMNCLENHLNKSLFNSNSEQIELTAEGKELYELIYPVKLLFNTIEKSNTATILEEEAKEKSNTMATLIEETQKNCDDDNERVELTDVGKELYAIVNPAIELILAIERGESLKELEKMRDVVINKVDKLKAN